MLKFCKVCLKWFCFSETLKLLTFSWGSHAHPNIAVSRVTRILLATAADLLSAGHFCLQTSNWQIYKIQIGVIILEIRYSKLICVYISEYHQHVSRSTGYTYWLYQMFCNSSIIGFVTNSCISLNSFIILYWSCQGTGARIILCGNARGTAVMWSLFLSSGSFRM